MKNEIQDIIGKPASIILADDSEPDREIIRRSLFDEGHFKCNMYEVENGEQLIKFLTKQVPYNDTSKYKYPDLILLDINMPRINGIEALKIIRQDLKLTLPVIILTTSLRDQDVIESYKLGVNAYVSKPVELGPFLEAIQKLERFWLDLVVAPKNL